MPKELKAKIEELLAIAGYSPRITTPSSEVGQDLMDLLDELQPYDIATILPELDWDHQVDLLRILPSGIAASTLEHLDHDDQYRLIDHLDDVAVRAILAEMSSDALVDLIGAIHPRQAKEILRRVPVEDLAGIRQLMTYPDYTAGGRMTIGYIAVRQEWTAEQVIAHFRKVGAQADLTNYLYIVDKDGRLVGVTSLREVLLSPPKTPIFDFMYTKVVSIMAETDQEQAARVLGQYDFLALPVVTNSGRMVGVITADDVIDVFEQEATEDIQLLGGSQPLDEPYLQSSFSSLFRKRIGWLLVLFVAASFTGNILQYYEGYLDQVVALAFFIPLLIGTGGNSGSQASTMVIRAMAVGEVSIKDFMRVVWREARLGLALGIAMAIASFIRSYFLGGPANLGLTVASAVCLIVVVGSTFGAALPILGKRIGLDPAVFSAPMITTVADTAGLIIYFQMARLIMGLGN